MCIPFWWKCDNHTDCTEGEDEAESECAGKTYHCHTPGLFQCADATSDLQCFSPTSICNGVSLTAVYMYMYMYVTNFIITSLLFFSQERDCADGSDEVNCEAYTCLASQIKCHNRGINASARCIDRSKQCDGRSDCEDFSDEKNCRKLWRALYSCIHKYVIVVYICSEDLVRC